METELFAIPWFITLMLHLKSPKHQVLNSKLNRKNEFELKVIDFLCLDGSKALIKIPICALMSLDNSSKLDQVFSMKEQTDQANMPAVRRYTLPMTPFVNKPSPKINAKWLNNSSSQKSDYVNISINYNDSSNRASETSNKE